MRYAIALWLMITALTCREIQSYSLVQPDAGFRGYQLNGTVRTGTGAPVDSVSVTLSYVNAIIGSSPMDTQIVMVTNPNQILDVKVFTPGFEQVRKLYPGTFPVGIVPRYQWDGVGDDGKLVPSGKYLVRYSVDAAIVKYSTVVISGNVTALSDANGRFTLPAARLPIDQVYDKYSTDGVYIGTAVILPAISIALGKPPSTTIVRSTFSLQRDQVTVASFTLNLQ